MHLQPKQQYYALCILSAIIFLVLIIYRPRFRIPNDTRKELFAKANASLNRWLSMNSEDECTDCSKALPPHPESLQEAEISNLTAEDVAGQVAREKSSSFVSYLESIDALKLNPASDIRSIDFFLRNRITPSVGQIGKNSEGSTESIVAGSDQPLNTELTSLNG